MAANVNKIYKHWGGWTAALIAVPLVLGVIELLAEVEHLHFLLFPSTAAVALSLFTSPFGPNTTWRAAVAAPVLGAFIGMVAANVLTPGFLEVVIVTAASMVGMRLLGVVVPAVLACAIVPLFAGPDYLTIQYPIMVFVAKNILFLMFHGWRRTIPAAK
jgi:hypothetical protein